MTTREDEAFDMAGSLPLPMPRGMRTFGWGVVIFHLVVLGLYVVVVGKPR